jgi:hypothetical protein
MCGRPLGLIHHTYLHWHGTWWEKLRFCSRKCHDGFRAQRDEEMKRAVAALFHPPRGVTTAASSSQDYAEARDALHRVD